MYIIGLSDFLFVVSIDNSSSVKVVLGFPGHGNGMRCQPRFEFLCCGVQWQLRLQVKTIVLHHTPDQRHALSYSPSLPHIRRDVPHGETDALCIATIRPAFVYEVEVV